METSLLARLLGAARAVTPLAPVNPATLFLPQLALGQTVRAQVTTRLADGTFRVVVDDAPLKLALPAGTKSGDVLTLRLVAREPRLEFELTRPVESAQAQLSGTGRLIGQILREPANVRPQSHPVTPAPIADGAELQAPLARAIERSGLFYESHQARWIEGDFPLARLREEPQAALARARPLLDMGLQALGSSDERNEPDAATMRRDRGNTGFSMDPDLPADTEPHDKIQPQTMPMRAAIGSVAEDALETQIPDPPRASNAAGIGRDDDHVQTKLARELLPIVRQQLEAIETRQIVWQGELWPGQPIRWQIADREPDSEHPQAGRDWLTRLTLRLPALGEVDAKLAVTGHHVRVLIEAADAATAAAMRAASLDLVNALKAAGLSVAALEVRHHA